MNSARRSPGQAARLGGRQRRAVLASAAALLLSGLGWLCSHYWLSGPIPGLPHPAEAWWLRLHGAAVVAGLLALGSLLPGHVVNGLRQRHRRTSGMAVLGGTLALVVTGYGLYYLGGEDWRAVTSLLHWLAGLAIVPVVLLHVPRLAARRLIPVKTAGRGSATVVSREFRVSSRMS